MRGGGSAAPRSAIRGLLALGPHTLQPRELQRQLEREQVLVRKIQIRDALDALEPLADGVRVHVERPGAGRHAVAVGEEPLERLDEPGAASAVVLDQLRHRLAVAVVRRLIGLEVDEVTVGAELLLGHRTAPGLEASIPTEMTAMKSGGMPPFSDAGMQYDEKMGGLSVKMDESLGKVPGGTASI